MNHASPMITTKKAARLITALVPNASRSDSTLFLKASLSFDLGKGTSGTSFPRNAHSESHPSSTFHSRRRSRATMRRISAQCWSWTLSPYGSTPLRSDMYEGQRKRAGHKIRWWTCHCHQRSALNQLCQFISMSSSFGPSESHQSSHLNQSSLTATMFDITEACHCSTFRLVFRTILASG